MVLTAAQIQDALPGILPKVQKPGRYTGGELNQVVKDWASVDAHVCLVFPDIYDLGMSNLGLAILYEIINKRSDALAERSYLPWLDMEAQLRQNNIPLYSLEGKNPLSSFNIIGISLPYETLYTNTLNLIDLAGIPLRVNERSAAHPLIIAGGHAAFNPEPMHAFIDAFVIGEGEEVIHEMLDVWINWKKRQFDKSHLYFDLSRLEGVYVPSLYQAHYHRNHTFSHLEKLQPAAPETIRKRIVAILPPPPTRFIVPYIDTVHNRVPLEIMRGCTRGCRFCHAGMVTRPVRERSVAEIIPALAEALENTGFEEVGLLSLSSSDYSQIVDLLSAVDGRFQDERLSISLPSLRIETLSVELMECLRSARRGGFTLAPEAATDRMRNIINKPVSTQQLLDTAQEIFSHGWSTIKLYFMIGHPSETLVDVAAIAELIKTVLSIGHKTIGYRAQVHAGISTFIPKPHTPFQWTPCDTPEQIVSKQNLLKSHVRGKGLKLTWNPPESTLLEAWLSRGDRRMAEVIFSAWKLGAKFDAWNDQLNLSAWQAAFYQNGLDPSFYTHRPRPINEAFPWDHIDIGVSKKFLLQDFQWSLAGKTRPDCRDKCFACGILPKYNQLRKLHPGDAWKCPEVRTAS